MTTTTSVLTTPETRVEVASHETTVGESIDLCAAFTGGKRMVNDLSVTLVVPYVTSPDAAVNREDSRTVAESDAGAETVAVTGASLVESETIDPTLTTRREESIAVPHRLPRTLGPVNVTVRATLTTDGRTETGTAVVDVDHPLVTAAFQTMIDDGHVPRGFDCVPVDGTPPYVERVSFDETVLHCWPGTDTVGIAVGEEPTALADRTWIETKTPAGARAAVERSLDA